MKKSLVMLSVLLLSLMSPLVGKSEVYFSLSVGVPGVVVNPNYQPVPPQPVPEIRPDSKRHHKEPVPQPKQQPGKQQPGKQQPDGSKQPPQQGGKQSGNRR